MLEPFDALIGTWATEATHPLSTRSCRAASPSRANGSSRRRRATGRTVIYRRRD